MEQIVIDNSKLCFIFYQDSLIVRSLAPDSATVPTYKELSALSLPPSGWLAVTTQDGLAVQAMSLPQPINLPEGWQSVGLRASYELLSFEQYLQAGKAYQILYWDNHSRFCPVCGTPTQQLEPIMKRCPACGYELYPRINTAIIVLVKRGEDEVLLVHARNFKGSFKGLVAGFLEPGETLEQCVAREVMEETGLQIAHIRYVASQPWPYPSGLMVGFVADYQSGEIKMQESELSTAGFYHRDRLPEIPRKLSIARRLIDLWLERKI